MRELRLPVVEHASLDDPYEMLNHLEGIFSLVVGRTDDCPDAVNTAWLRLVQPREEESNRSRWDTDPTWRVIQSASFTAAPAPAPARCIIRRKQRAHNVQHLTSGSYGYLVSLITEQFPGGEQWDVSRGLRELAQCLTTEAAKPGKDFGELVRQRRKERGLSVLPRDEVLPALSSEQFRHRMAPTAAPEPDKPLFPWEEESDEQRPLLHRLCAERRMQEAFQALEDAELRQHTEKELRQLAAVYQRELMTFVAAEQPFKHEL